MVLGAFVSILCLLSPKEQGGGGGGPMWGEVLISPRENKLGHEPRTCTVHLP
jgi:hypothetical protein